MKLITFLKFFGLSLLESCFNNTGTGKDDHQVSHEAWHSQDGELITNPNDDTIENENAVKH